MRKVFFLVLAAMAAFTVQAQNIQLHYDFGRNIYSDEESDRQKVTVTVKNSSKLMIGGSVVLLLRP